MVPKMHISNTDEFARVHFIRMLKRGVLVLVFLVILVLLLSERERLLLLVDHPIEKMTVAGEFHYQAPEELKAHLSQFIGQGFLSADLGNIKQHIELLPWIEQATVSRVWPGEIMVSFEEQVAVSYWNDSGFINGRGELFMPALVPQGLPIPLLQNENASSDNDRISMHEMFEYIQNELSAFGLSAAALKQEVRGTWELTLSNGIHVVLGHVYQTNDSKKFLDDKLERVGKLLASSADLTAEKVNKLDTRYPNGIAVQWQNNIESN